MARRTLLTSASLSTLRSYSPKLKPLRLKGQEGMPCRRFDATNLNLI